MDEYIDDVMVFAKHWGEDAKNAQSALVEAEQVDGDDLRVRFTRAADLCIGHFGMIIEALGSQLAKRNHRHHYRRERPAGVGHGHRG